MKEEFHIPLLDLNPATILIHRDLHFGGDWEVMLHYYQEHKKGVFFSLEEIEALMEATAELEEPLALHLLGEEERRILAGGLERYAHIREEIERGEEGEKAHALASLILAEEEEEEEALERVISLGEEMVPLLAEVIHSAELLSPFSPGFGEAPLLAIHALGEIGGEGAVVPLFEALAHGDAREEEALLALNKLEEVATPFAKRLLESEGPMTRDQERAALFLTHLEKEEEADLASLLQKLHDPSLRSSHTLLAATIESLLPLIQKEEEHQELLELLKGVSLPPPLEYAVTHCLRR